jgi:hypothetical protein
MEEPMKSTLYSTLLMLALGACTAEVQGESAQAGANPLENPDDDENLQWVKDNGFESTHFMKSCVSRGDDGSVIDTAPLPVGGGFQLECVTFDAPARDVTMTVGSDDAHWCVLGEVTSQHGGGDKRLAFQLLDTPADGPWTLRATAREAIDISTVEGFGATTWPVWVVADYRTVDLTPEQEGKTCAELFGL